MKVTQQKKMKKHSLNILGLSKVKWKKIGDCLVSALVEEAVNA